VPTVGAEPDGQRLADDRQRLIEIKCVVAHPALREPLDGFCAAERRTRRRHQ
jgi:hypothetical protein